MTATCIALATPLLIAGCGSDSDGTGDTRTATVMTTTATDAASATTGPSSSGSTDLQPDELGQEIGVVYVAAYDDVIITLADRPEPADAYQQLDTLKDGYIQQLVVLGQQREELDAPGRVTVDGAIMSALTSLPEETLAEYQAAIDYYASDAELDELIRSFNIIGQYANFDLLREQEPDEAARLGLD